MRKCFVQIGKPMISLVGHIDAGEPENCKIEAQRNGALSTVVSVNNCVIAVKDCKQSAKEVKSVDRVKLAGLFRKSNVI